MKSFCLTALLLLVLVPVSFAQGSSDARVTENASGKLRMLTQRAARQYTMYQYGVGDLAVTKEPLLETVEQINLSLRRLHGGETVAEAAPVSSPEILSQLKLVDEKWQKLEKIFTYQPYRLFQAKELLPPAVRKQDPVLVRYVDRLTQELLAEWELLIDAYTRHCQATGSAACQESVRDIGTQMLLIESVTNNLLFTVLDIDRSERRAQLRSKTAELEISLENGRSPRAYGDNPSVLIEPVLDTIAGYWNQMKASVDLAVKGDEDEVNINQLLRSQQRLQEEIDNLTSILAGH